MLMAEFPGFLQLQAGLLDPRLNLDRADIWKHLADDDLQHTIERSWWHNADFVSAMSAWGVPTQGVLDQAVSLRKRLDEQRERTLGGFTSQLLLVVGKARFTPDGYDLGNDGLEYLNAQEAGDGRVTLQSALLPGVRTWLVDCDHGHLPAEGDAFDAYLDLLQRGSTDRLRSVTAPSRGAVGAPAPIHVRSRPSRAGRPAVRTRRSHRRIAKGLRPSPLLESKRSV